MAGREYLASVSLPVPDRAAHITVLFVPNVTPLGGKEGIPSLSLVLFPRFLSLSLCAAMTEPSPQNITDVQLSLESNTNAVQPDLIAPSS